MRSLVLAVAASTWLAAGPTYAGGGTRGDFEIGPHIGYSFLDQYAGHSPKNALFYGVRVGYFFTDNVSIEPSWQLLRTDTQRASGVDNSVSLRSLRINMLYNWRPESRIRPFFTGGLGWENTHIDQTTNADDLGVNLGAGIRFFIADYFAIRLEGRYVHVDVSGGLNDRQNNYEGFGAFTFLFGGKPASDTDQDRVADKKDKCSDTPLGALVDKSGCPSDADVDGVFDGIDKCPRTLKGLVVNEQGCDMDTDGDKVPDGPDRCPDTVAGVVVDDQGCAKDADGDGVANASDQCPETPTGVPVDEKGCPLDTDLDGVTDDIDKCPDTAKGTKIDAMGCPIVSKARGVLKGVQFKFGSADLTVESLTILDGVALALNEFPKVQVEVQGHTDSVGADEVNQQVSEKRAQSVQRYLVSKGVSPDRVMAKGYGEGAPMASNKTKQGRSKNRRVELKWIE